MGTQENLAATEACFAAFTAGDLEGAIGLWAKGGEITVHGEHALSATVRGHDEIRDMLVQLGTKGMTTGPTRYIADGDTVVIFNFVGFGEDAAEIVEVLDFDGQAKCVRFQTFGAEGLFKRVYG